MGNAQRQQQKWIQFQVGQPKGGLKVKIEEQEEQI